MGSRTATSGRCEQAAHRLHPRAATSPAPAMAGDGHERDRSRGPTSAMAKGSPAARGNSRAPEAQPAARQAAWSMGPTSARLGTSARDPRPPRALPPGAAITGGGRCGNTAHTRKAERPEPWARPERAAQVALAHPLGRRRGPAPEPPAGADLTADHALDPLRTTSPGVPGPPMRPRRLEMARPPHHERQLPGARRGGGCALAVPGLHGARGGRTETTKPQRPEIARPPAARPINEAEGAAGGLGHARAHAQPAARPRPTTPSVPSAEPQPTSPAPPRQHRNTGLGWLRSPHQSDRRDEDRDPRPTSRAEPLGPGLPATSCISLATHCDRGAWVAVRRPGSEGTGCRVAEGSRPGPP